jgi:hypothetical protein
MKKTFKDLEIGDCFMSPATGVCIKTNAEYLYEEHDAVSYRSNAFLIGRRMPIFVPREKPIIYVDLVSIGSHIWFPVFSDEDGGIGPFEIEFLHDPDTDFNFIPVRPGIVFQKNRAQVTGLLQDTWDFVSYDPLVPYQKNFIAASS